MSREAQKHAKFIEHSNTWAHKARKNGKNVKHAKHTSTQALQLPYMVEVDSWLYIYSDEILKWFVNHHINIFWFQIYLYFLSFRNWTLLWKTSADWLKSFAWGWSKNIKINSFTDHLLFFTLSLLSLDVIYGFCLDASENKIWCTYIQPYFTAFYTKLMRYQLFTIAVANYLLKLFYFHWLMLWE